MGKFPCKYNFKDVIKFKMRRRGIVEGYIVGTIINSIDTDNEQPIYQVHSTDETTPSFYFKEVKESEILKD